MTKVVIRDLLLEVCLYDHALEQGIIMNWNKLLGTFLARTWVLARHVILIP